MDEVARNLIEAVLQIGGAVGFLLLLVAGLLLGWKALGLKASERVAGRQVMLLGVCGMILLDPWAVAGFNEVLAKVFSLALSDAFGLPIPG